MKVANVIKFINDTLIYNLIVKSIKQAPSEGWRKQNCSTIKKQFGLDKTVS